MAYGRELYTLPGSAIDAAVIYDNTEAKMQSEVNADLKTKLDGTFKLYGGATVIPTNTDLNTLKEPGNYRGLDGNTYTNKPSGNFTTLFTLRVYNSTGLEGSYYKHQIIIPHDLTNNHIWIRQLSATASNPGTWSSWIMIPTGADITSKFPVSIANGGTGATTQSAAKENLGICDPGQNFYAGNFTGSGQVFGISAICTNTNSTLKDKRVSLVIKEDAILAWNSTGSTQVWQLNVPVSVAQGGTGATTAAAARTNLSVLGTAGGTLTGDVFYKSSTKVDGTAPDNELAAPHIYFRDKNDKTLGDISHTITTSNNSGIVIQSRRTVSDVVKRAYLALYLKSDGTENVVISSPTAWRKSLNLGTDGVIPITVAQGGTGHTQVVSTNNTTGSGICTVSSGFSFTGTQYLLKWGKMAQVNLTFKCTTATSNGASQGVQLGTMTAGNHPVASIAVMSSNSKYARIDNEGKIVVYGDFAVNNTVAIRCAYLLAN